MTQRKKYRVWRLADQGSNFFWATFLAVSWHITSLNLSFLAYIMRIHVKGKRDLA